MWSFFLSDYEQLPTGWIKKKIEGCKVTGIGHENLTALYIQSPHDEAEHKRLQVLLEKQMEECAFKKPSLMEEKQVSTVFQCLRYALQYFCSIFLLLCS